MSSRKRTQPQKIPKNTKRLKVSDPIEEDNSALTLWETLPREIWETIFDSFDDKYYWIHEFRTQPRNVQLEFLRVASKSLNKLCKQYLKRVNEKESKRHSLTVWLADRGYFSCLKYALDNGIRLDPEVLSAAIRSGHIDIAKYYIEDLKARWTVTAVNQIVIKDDVELLKYAHKHGAEEYLENLVGVVAKKGSIKCLKYLRNNTKASQWSQLHVCANAAASGSLECLQYLHEDLQFVWDVRTAVAAAQKGHLHILQYYHDNDGELGRFITTYCAKGGNLECVKYGLENGAIATVDDINEALGHYDCLKYLHELFGEWPNEIEWSNAADNDAVECYQYAHEHGAPWENEPCEAAAEWGAIKCLKYAHENGAEWYSEICIEAARNLPCLKYLHENGAEWNERTIESAVHYGAIECVKYMHENGCPWDSISLVKAAKDLQKFECLKYLVENGCPWDKAACDECADPAIKQYLHEHGCPCDCNVNTANKSTTKKN